MTETYYKAIQPNGTDFYSGTVRWLPPVGESLPKKGLVVTHPTVRKKSPGDACDYLSVATTPTDCTSMVWPCRLARVERTRAAVWAPDADRLPHKRASWRWRVVEELDPTLALGPQGAEVAALIDRAGRLTAAEVDALQAAWGAAQGDACDNAWNAALYTSRESRDAAWVAAANAAMEAALAAANAATQAARFVAQAAADAATEAALAAALATLTRDLISESVYQLLAGPWLRVIGDE